MTAYESRRQDIMIKKTDFWPLFVNHFRTQVSFTQKQERDAALPFISFQKLQDAMYYLNSSLLQIWNKSASALGRFCIHFKC